MSMQQDIYAAGSESRPPMLNKENYVPWSSRLFHYAKSRPNGKLIHNSIINGPLVGRMIPEPGDTNREVPVNETFHVQTDDELTEKELKQIEADDQAIQNIFLDLPEDIYAAVDSCETAQEIWLRVQQMTKGSDIGIQEKKAKLFNELERFTSNEGESTESYYHRFLKLMNDLKRNKHFLEKITSNLKFLNNLQPEWSRHEVDELKAEQLVKIQDPLALMANSNNPYVFPAPHQDQPSFNQNYMQHPMPNPKDITNPTTAMNMALALMAKAFKLSYSTPTNNQRISSNPRNRHIAQPGNANQNLNGNGNLVAARAEGNTAGQNGNQIRCYNCRGVVEEFDLMAAAADLDEIKEVNANCILMANLQQASTSGTQSDKAPVYDSDGSAEILTNSFQRKKSIVSFLLEEKKRLKFDFKTREDELLDKQIQLEKKIKELNNILVKTGQSIQMIHMLSPKSDSFYHTEQKMAWGYQNPFYLKQAQKKQQSLYDGKVLLEKHDPPVVHDFEETLQLAQEKFSDDTTPSVARKFLNEVKSTIVTLQRVVKHRMTLETRNWSPSAHQELHKIVKDENFPIVNQVDARVQNFEIQFLKEAAKFVGDFKSLAKEADESLAKHKVLELEIEHLLRAVVSQDIMSVVQKTSVVDTSNLQTELEPYKDMQQKIERLQAPLGDLKGKSKDTSCVSDTRNPLSQKLKNKNVELEFQVLNYARENAHLKATYKNLFDFISVSRTQTKTIIASFQNELQNTIYKNAKLRTQLFTKVSNQKENTHDMSVNTKVAKQSIMENLPTVGETHALSNPVTSNSVSTPQESKGVNNDKVITSRMFRINPFKTSREEKHVPNNISASARTKPINMSQPSVITKKEVNSDSNGTDNTKSRRPQPRSNTKNDRVPSASKSSRSKNKGAEVEEHHRNLLLSKNTKHMSSACNNIKLDSQNVISKVICAMFKQCLISVNHDICLRNYVNGKNSRGKKHKANVSIKEKQKKHQPQVKKPKKVGFIERLATPKLRKPRFLLRWSPTGRLFDQKGKLVDSSESKSQSDCFNGYPDLFMVHRLGLLQAHDRKSKASHHFVWKFMGNVRFENDHVAAILGFDSLDPIIAMNMALALIAKAFKVNIIPTNNNQRSSLIPHNSQIAQPGINTSQDIKMQMVDDNAGNQNPGIQIVENMNRLSDVLKIANQYGNGNVATTPAEGNGNGINGNPIRCYNCQGEGHCARNCTESQGNEMMLIFSNSCRLLKRKKHGSKALKRNLTKFVRDFKSHAKEADESLAKYKALELEFECLLRAIVSQDIMSIVQNQKVASSVGRSQGTNPSKTSRVDNVVPNKPVKTSVKIKPITVSQPNVIHKQQANSDSNGFSSTRVNNTAKTRRPHHRSNYNTDRVPSKSKSSCLSNNKFENENVELEFQVRNYERENAHLKTAYKNLFDSVNATQTQTKTIINSLQTKLHDTIYENAKLRAQLFDRTSEQKDTTKGTSVNT
nr:hypothetical protein [Tanacetum cinerariifolium]